MTESQEEKHHWVIIFKEGGRPYTYLNRTVPEMTEVVKRSHSKHRFYPHRMWVIVNDEIHRVVIE